MSLLTGQPVNVELEISQHLVPNTGRLCDIEDHGKCDWETILKTGLMSLYPEIRLRDLRSDADKITFKISYTNRTARKSDVAAKLDELFRIHPMMAVKSVKITQS